MKNILNLVKINNIGNTYIYMDYNPEYKEEDYSKLSIEISSVINGLSSDGLITIQKLSPKKFKMKIYNKDGTLAKMCGNGLRGSVYYILYKKLYLINDKYEIYKNKKDKNSNLEHNKLEHNKIVNYDNSKEKYNLEENVLKKSKVNENKIEEKRFEKSNYNINKLYINTDSGLKNIYIVNKKNIVKQYLKNYKENFVFNNKEFTIISHIGNPFIVKNIENIKINFNKFKLKLFGVDIGNLHYIYLFDEPVTLDNFYNFNLEELFTFTHENFFFNEWQNKKEMVNVTILMLKDNKYYIRTRERGAFETLSCGTASASSAFVLNKLNFDSFENSEDLEIKNYFTNFIINNTRKNNNTLTDYNKNIKKKDSINKNNDNIIFANNIDKKNVKLYTMIHKGGSLKNIVLDNKVYQTGNSNIVFEGKYYFNSKI